MNILDLCDDVIGLVVTQLYRNRAEANRRHFEYLVAHALHTMKKPFCYEHVKQFFLLDWYHPCLNYRLINHKHDSRQELAECFENNNTTLNKRLNRKQLCASLVQQGIVYRRS